MTLVHEATIFLTAAVVSVPIFKHLGLGSIIGYLVAGIIIGPYFLGLVGNAVNVLHFAELGVVFFLFLVGLELKPARLWALRGPIFGLGGAQLLLSALLIGLLSYRFYPLLTTVFVGFSLALSSTAFALQMLSEKKQLASRHGRVAFAILLFQDLSVAPMLALIPLFAKSHSEFAWTGLLQAVGMIALLIAANRVLVRPFFRFVASTSSQEILTAAALLLVLATSLAADAVGLSMALGAFLAGVLLADSEFRHQLEADIEPFKAILLGLFFIAIGMMINIELLKKEPGLVVIITLSLISIKSVVLYFLGRVHGLDNRSACLLAATLSQGGEFAFVILTVAISHHFLDQELNSLMILAVSLSMALTPLLYLIVDKLASPPKEEQREEEIAPEQHNPIIIAGFGRVGQIIARVLSIKKIPFTALESHYEQVDFVRLYGNKIYYGDASRLEVLKAAGIANAEILVLALQDIEASINITRLVRRNYPHIKIFARARNRKHAHLLMDVGVFQVIRDTLHSSLVLASGIMEESGLSTEDAKATTETFRHFDEELFMRQHAIHDNQGATIASTREVEEELQLLFQDDSYKGVLQDKDDKPDNEKPVS